MYIDFAGRKLHITDPNTEEVNTPKLFSQIKMAKSDESSIKVLAKIEKQDLLILDDFGIQPFYMQSRLTLLEIIEDRHGKRSTVFTLQVPVRQWHKVIGE